MKKGFTLVELIATIIILSLIAAIVTPSILVSIREYKQQVNETNLESIKAAAKNWSTDHIDDVHFPEDEQSSLIVTIQELEDGGYVKEDVKDVIDGGKFNDSDHFTFVLITCQVIEDENEINKNNYTYSYQVFTSINKMIEKKAIEYAKDNNISSDTTVLYQDLVYFQYLPNEIFYSEEYKEKNNKEKLVIPTISSIKITPSEKDGEYEYSIVINWA